VNTEDLGSDEHFNPRQVAKMLGALIGGVYLSGDATEADIKKALRAWLDGQSGWQQLRAFRAMTKPPTSPEGK